MKLRRLLPEEWDSIAELIYHSTNEWYEKNLNHGIFTGPPSVARVFPEVYEALDPGHCIVMEDDATGTLAGSCFYHPRETHFSLGIMNVHANYGGKGIARTILAEILRLADEAQKPVRLVSSALNLDSFSLYTRAGFVPRAIFQDMLLPVPDQGLPHPPTGSDRVRPATLDDVSAIADLEMELAHIRREGDYRHFIENAAGIWHISVIDSAAGHGAIDGFLASVNHPGSNLLGPGVMRDEAAALALIYAELNQHCGQSPVFLVPADQAGLVEALYARGARNCELHVCQVRGAFQPFSGVVMPTFMPETA